jgi:hypothetical protein
MVCDIHGLKTTEQIFIPKSDDEEITSFGKQNAWKFYKHTPPKFFMSTQWNLFFFVSDPKPFITT